LDGVAGGLIAVILLNRLDPKYRIGRKHAPDNGFTHHANIDK